MSGAIPPHLKYVLVAWYLIKHRDNFTSLPLLIVAFCCSTTYTTAAYGSNPNVFIRLDSVGRAGSVGSGSYATIASFHKLPLPLSRRSSPSPCPYATANIGSAVGSATYIASTNGSGRYSHHIYSKPASTYCPSRVSYYASSQLTHLSQVRRVQEAVNSLDIYIYIYIYMSCL
jgi:hypothetical protein